MADSNSINTNAIDTLQARLSQIGGVLSSLSMALDGESTTPTRETMQSTIWAARTLLEQAQSSTAALSA
jgi:hypothetical protein